MKKNLLNSNQLTTLTKTINHCVCKMLNAMHNAFALTKPTTNFKKTAMTLMAFAVLFFGGVERSVGQLFQQQFGTALSAFSNSSLVNSTYINASPSSTQFTGINSSGTGSVISIASNKLTLARTGNGWDFVRGIAFSGPPSSLIVRFDFANTASTSATTSATVFAVGGGTTVGSNTTSITSSDAHSRLAFNCTEMPMNLL